MTKQQPVCALYFIVIPCGLDTDSDSDINAFLHSCMIYKCGNNPGCRISPILRTSPVSRGNPKIQYLDDLLGLLLA
jgi:hypothetical protein